ncbi:MAG: glucose/arabinose dehydrogenase, partial [Pirellulaceae bacterium]
MSSRCFRFVLLVACGFALQFRAIARAEESLPPDAIRCLPGFAVELLRTAQAGEDSWISMSIDDRGRIILGLDGTGVARLTLSERADSAKFERLDNTLKHCRGVLWAHGSVYVDATNSQKIVRLRDGDGDDQYKSQQTILHFDYRSRYGHGSNQMRLGPDGNIYVVIGNDCSFPSNTLGSSPYRNPRNDWLLPNSRDVGHDNRVGYILKMDAEGAQRQIIAGGFRNQVDAAFNRHGDMFTFDADMEWDIGAPWYRPIRVNHIVSGGEYGWRWGTGKWPAYYPDSLPSNLDVGLGSPTGVVFGTKAKFPAKYQKALFLGDWQNGRILAAHPKVAGASYSFEYESFLDGAPLNVCDLEFGLDGNLYFITGGRGSQSALYRVSWKGEMPKENAVSELSELHVLRRKLESLHAQAQPQAVAFAWPHLGHPDPWIRHAARVAIERQVISQWENKVYAEQNVETILNGLIALCRMKETNESNRHEFIGRVVEKLTQFPDPDPRQLIAICRIYALL